MKTEITANHLPYCLDLFDQALAIRVHPPGSIGMADGSRKHGRDRPFISVALPFGQPPILALRQFIQKFHPGFLPQFRQGAGFKNATRHGCLASARICLVEAAKNALVTRSDLRAISASSRQIAGLWKFRLKTCCSGHFWLVKLYHETNPRAGFAGFI
jgi:hypothetical protein